jgi:hypothetical protein
MPTYIRHCPHRPNDTPESAELHSSSKMKYLIRNTLLGQLCRGRSFCWVVLRLRYAVFRKEVCYNGLIPHMNREVD